MPTGTPNGFTVTVKVAGVKSPLGVTVSQLFPPPGAVTASEKATAAPPEPESATDCWRDVLGTLKVSDAGAATINRLPPTVNVIGTFNVGNPAAATETLAVYVAEWPSREFRVVTSIPT